VDCREDELEELQGDFAVAGIIGMKAVDVEDEVIADGTGMQIDDRASR
jgi:hypothetical protein